MCNIKIEYKGIMYNIKVGYVQYKGLCIINSVAYVICIYTHAM